jgi:hypothetical protein
MNEAPPWNSPGKIWGGSQILRPATDWGLDEKKRARIRGGRWPLAGLEFAFINHIASSHCAF